LPAPPKSLEKKITFEDIENEIEQNLIELRTLYERLQDLNQDLGQTVMHREFLKAVEVHKLDSYFKFVGKEEAKRLISKSREDHCGLIEGDNPGYLNESPDMPDMRMNYYHYTSGVFPRKYFQQINRLLFRITKSNAIIQIFKFDQTQLKSRILT
jgi:hypothetical protein